MSRAILAARSALLRWSAAMISILRPSTSPPKSSAAILAAVSLPDPVISAYSPDISRMAPSFKGGLDWAIALAAAITIAEASNPDANLVIATSHNHAASLLRRVFLCRQSCRNPPAAASRRLFPQNGMRSLPAQTRKSSIPPCSSFRVRGNDDIQQWGMAVPLNDDQHDSASSPGSGARMAYRGRLREPGACGHALQFRAARRGPHRGHHRRADLSHG